MSPARTHKTGSRKRLLTHMAAVPLIAWIWATTGCDESTSSEPAEPTQTSETESQDRSATHASTNDTTPQEADRTQQPRTPRRGKLPPRSDTRFERAREHILAGRFQAGRNILELLVRDYPEYAEAEFFLALACHKLEDRQIARMHFENVLESDGNFSAFDTTNYYYGWCLYYLGELPEARAAFESFLKLRPGEADAHFGLGLIDYDQDRLSDAEKQFGTALQLLAREIAENPQKTRMLTAELSKCHARLADVYVRQNELDLARAHLVESTQLWPDHYTAHFKLYRVLTRLGEEEAAAEAMEAYRAAVKRVRPELLEQDPEEAGEPEQPDQ